MSKLQPVRGVHDLLPEDARRHRRIAETARSVAETFGFQPIATPIFEFTEVFVRSIGETTDIVSKEMYTFPDRSGDSLTLRPEGTAGVARAVISNGLTQTLPQRLFYYGPMFRHERPQKGRLRQFHQVGLELIGASEPLADVETIACAAEFLGALGVLDQTVLKINSLGDKASREAYRETLVAYLKRFEDKLSEDSLARLEKNPLRVLDSKDAGDREIVAGAPSLPDSLTDAAKAFFAQVCAGLDALGVAYEVDPTLVRGLDYYSHTAFEFVTTALGAQGTVLAGGRYDTLIEQMGGPPAPGIGWAAGVERLALLAGDPPPAPRPIALCPLGAAAETAALTLARDLRRAGRVVELGYAGNLKKRLQRATKANAAFAVILGDDELARGVAMVRDLDAGSQAEVALADLGAHFAG